MTAHRAKISQPPSSVCFYSPRVERFRLAVIDRVVPSFDWAMVPVTGTINLVRDFQSYQRIYQQNQELRRELQQTRACLILTPYALIRASPM